MPTDYRPPIADFPLLSSNREITYFDSAATTQKPRQVLNAVSDYYVSHNANVHRGIHWLSDAATNSFEQARLTLARFVNARSHQEIIWTRGTTEGINLVAHAFAPTVLDENSIVLISHMEHHSNIVPWQIACQRSGASIRAVQVQSDGTLDLEHFEQLLDNRVKIVAIAHISNVLGTVNPINDITRKAHDIGATVVIDGAQAAAHVDIDVQDIDCDFYALSGHKMYGPTGVGVLYGRLELLQQTSPWHGGGEMIESVTLETSTYQDPPAKFEAGTPDIAGAIGLAAAVSYLATQKQHDLQKYEDELLLSLIDSLKQIPGLKIIGTADTRCAVVSFLVDQIHPHDLGALLNEQRIAVRTGHHCAMPLMQTLKIPGTVRASLGLYNSIEDVQKLTHALDRACRLFT